MSGFKRVETMRKVTLKIRVAVDIVDIGFEACNWGVTVRWCFCLMSNSYSDTVTDSLPIFSSFRCPIYVTVRNKMLAGI